MWSFYEVNSESWIREVYRRFEPDVLESFFYGEVIDPERFVRIFTHGSTLWEVYHDEEAAGIITGYTVSRCCVKMGIASYNGRVDVRAFAIMPRIEKRLAERGICVIAAEIPKFKRHIQRLMGAFGYGKSGEIAGYFGPGDNLVIYTKQIGERNG